MTQRAFSEKIGISQSAVSSLFSQRENRPGLEMLQKIAIAFPELSMDWLLVGRGPMLLGADSASSDASTQESEREMLSHRRDMQAFGYQLGNAMRTLNYIRSEVAHLTARKAALLERDVAGKATDEDREAYQRANEQWQLAIQQQQHIEREIQGLTYALSQAQGLYIAAIDPLATHTTEWQPESIPVILHWAEGALRSKPPESAS